MEKCSRAYEVFTMVTFHRMQLLIHAEEKTLQLIMDIHSKLKNEPFLRNEK
jgi:hypothetical protein